MTKIELKGKKYDVNLIDTDKHYELLDMIALDNYKPLPSTCRAIVLDVVDITKEELNKISQPEDVSNIANEIINYILNGKKK